MVLRKRTPEWVEKHVKKARTVLLVNGLIFILAGPGLLIAAFLGPDGWVGFSLGNAFFPVILIALGAGALVWRSRY